MKHYKEYDHEEIVAIADAFSAGEIIPTGIKTWYEYKKAVQNCIRDGDFWKNHENKDSEVVQSILGDIQKAESELAWMRSIHTYNLPKVCEFITLDFDEFRNTADFWDFGRMEMLMAKRVLDGVSKEEEQTIRELFEESSMIHTINLVRNLTAPVSTRNWSRSYNRATEYNPWETPMDATELYDEREHYVYIESETKGKWGDTYWVSVDCSNSLGSLPVIKDFKNYDFKVGGFYKITCTDTIYFGGNKKKYVMDIQESTEEEFMENGFKAYATRRW